MVRVVLRWHVPRGPKMLRTGLLSSIGQAVLSEQSRVTGRLRPCGLRHKHRSPKCPRFGIGIPSLTGSSQQRIYSLLHGITLVPISTTQLQALSDTPVHWLRWTRTNKVVSSPPADT
ncbi:hypothetical protein BO78DRAFT_60192 [Aspergillus sclerotiicarbonarius CBS 121057]|uniref:Uncharacterized protein n=1 Tax=Aspergillus sclerotiicarbonarius (strain CBS 121057 / IBT 28362) TaxID=1448318 RepID=A0A319F0U2_ASPSB|nr:hypothetical protein BO78DRAFT_60192 [Aspergillus sclerotiicarbonarius CBS 121057]